ncbi:MAG TPA: DUF4239 domain-containing protein [Dehalococcoidia bacterium]|nr:DUF4239 domain-containing protein [Dehalococcoidia bacterium]
MLDTLRKTIAVRPRFWVLTTVTSAVILLARYGFDTESHFASDGGAVRAYISAISTLFGILAAFIIYVVWSQFIEADHAIKLEANELLDLCRYAVYLNDPAALDSVTAAVGRYASAVCEDEWTTMPAGRAHPAAEGALEGVFAAVNSVRFDDDRDSTAWSRMIQKFEAVSDARDKRIELAGERMPALMRGLLYMVSGLLLLGFFMMAIQNDLLAVAVTVGTTAVVFLTIEVMEDIDNPFDGQWAISHEPFQALRRQLPALFRREEARSA